MEQWLEEIDLLEEEFRRLIRACEMAARAQTRFGKSGGTSLKEGESLSEHVRRWRPKTTVEWSKIQVDDVSTV